MVPKKVVSIDYPEFDGFSVNISYLGREALQAINKRCEVTKWDKKTHQMVTNLDMEKFVKEYTKQVIVGWEGLKFSYLEKILLVDVTDFNPDDCLPYTEDNAVELMLEAKGFDEWVMSMVSDLQNFTQNK